MFNEPIEWTPEMLEGLRQLFESEGESIKGDEDKRENPYFRKLREESEKARESMQEHLQKKTEFFVFVMCNPDKLKFGSLALLNKGSELYDHLIIYMQNESSPKYEVYGACGPEAPNFMLHPRACKRFIKKNVLKGRWERGNKVIMSIADNESVKNYWV